MAIGLSQCLPPARALSSEVTHEEIAATERILHSIDTSNQTLAALSQWLLIWENVRNLSFRLYDSSLAAQEALNGLYLNLVQETTKTGNALLAQVDSLPIPPEHLALATGCSRSDVAACLELLHDLKTMHSETPEILAGAAQVWETMAREPDAVV